MGCKRDFWLGAKILRGKLFQQHATKTFAGWNDDWRSVALLPLKLESGFCRQLNSVPQPEQASRRET
jgi:hypothetical protein